MDEPDSQEPLIQPPGVDLSHCQALLDALPDSAAVLDPAGRILAVNHRWRAFGIDNGMPRHWEPVATDYLEVCQRASGTDAMDGMQACAGIGAVLAGRESRFTMEYPCHDLHQQRWFLLQVSPLVFGTWRGALVQHLDIRDRVLAMRRSALHARHLESVLSFNHRLLELEGDIDGLMDQLPAIAQEMLEADGASLLLVKGEQLLYRSVSGMLSPLQAQRVALRGNLFAGAIAGNRVVVWEAGDDAGQKPPPTSLARGVKSLVAAPFGGEHGIQGFLEVVGGGSRRFEPGDISALQLMVDALGNALRRQVAARRLKESEEQYRQLFYGNPVPMMIFDLETLAYLAVNDAVVTRYGYSREELLGMTVSQEYSPERTVELRDQLARLKEGANPVGILSTRDRRGRQFEEDVTWYPVTYQGRRACLAVAVDVTARKASERQLRRLNRAQRMLSLCNSALVRASDEDSLLKEIARITTSEGQYCFAWIGLVEHDAQRTVKVAARSGQEIFQRDLGDLRLSWDDNTASGQGITGQTIRTGQPVICEDIATAIGDAGRLRQAMESGLKGLLSLPLRGSGGVFGLIALYSDRLGGFPEEEVALCQELADNLAYGIEHLREVAQRRQLQSAFKQVASGVSSATGPGFFTEFCAALARTLEADVCIVGRLDASEPPRVAVVGGVVGGAPVLSGEYPMDVMAWEGLRRDGEFVVEAGARTRFPGFASLESTASDSCIALKLSSSEGRPLGVLFTAFRQPLEKTDFIVAALRIFATRAAAELEREDATAHQRELAALLDKAWDAIVVMTPDYFVTFWNKGAERLYGIPASKVVGQRHGADRHGRVIADLRDAMATTLEKGEWQGRLRQARWDGTPITVQAHWTLTSDEQGQSQAIFCVHNDITARLALEARLQQSQRLESLGQLMGGMAHDFNNLLTVILGNAELLVEELANDSRLRELARMVCNASQRGADLTSRLLAVARRQPLAPGHVDVGALLADMQGLLGRTLRGNIRMRVYCAPDTWPAMVDPAQLESAVLNLCINARDAMPEGGDLTIETQNYRLEPGDEAERRQLEPGDFVVIRIRDTGVGVPPELLPKLFDPFFTTKDKDRGTGLGLSMVHGFVKQSHGDISVESEQGFGTLVTLLLPRALGDGSASQSVPAIDGSAGGQPGVVLLVEDEALVRAHAAGLLRNAGYQVVEAVNGADALAVLARGEPVDLLFTDVIMPGGMTGPELVRRARQSRPGLKVLYTSGYSEDALAGEARDQVLLLAKPYRQTELLTMVHKALHS